MLKKTKKFFTVKSSIKYKIALIIGFILFMDIGVSMNTYFHNEIKEQEAIIFELASTVEEFELQEELYQNSLKRIVSNLYEEELFIEAGGAGIDIDTYSIDLIYQAIVNASSNFSHLLDNVENYFEARKDYLDNIPSIWPIEYSELARITDNYGMRIYPFTGTLHFHKGIDIAAASNTKVVATADGVVINHWIPPKVSNNAEGHDIYGGMIEIDHGNGFTTLYGHLSATEVSEVIGRPNNIVKRGQVIGEVGNTGRSRGIHVHYEVKYEGELVDPIDYLSSNRTVFMNESVDLK
jgi:murein DD-endopeptidase MepM/ murein hydrolase activator NlpD